MRHGCIFVFILSTLSTVGAEPGTAPPAHRPRRPEPGGLPERYGVLLSRSIFARDGTPAPPGSFGPDRTALAGKWGGSTGPALRGVVLKDGVYTAVIEDQSSHQTQNLAVGASINAGQISEISLHGIEYEKEGRIITIAVGQDLSGHEVAPIAPPTTEPSKIATEHRAGSQLTEPAGAAPEVAVDGAAAHPGAPGRPRTE